jgi:diacylglycerol kinase family enzyme
MNLFLLHNEKAGHGKGPTADQLLSMMRDCGHTVQYQSTRPPAREWKLAPATDAVVAAGGDGTVRKAALAAGRRQIPFAILPLGTANNIAHSFGPPESPERIIPRLAQAQTVPIDLGRAAGPWGEVSFLESAGGGVIARAISYLSHRRGPGSTHSVDAALAHLSQQVKHFPGQDWAFGIDGRKFSGRFLLVEAMNTPSLGPNLLLAPDSHPGDRQFDFVLVREEARSDFAHFLRHSTERPRLPPPVERIRGQRLSLTLSHGGAVHADDYTWPQELIQAHHPSPPSVEHAFSLTVTLDPTPIRMLKVT